MDGASQYPEDLFDVPEESLGDWWLTTFGQGPVPTDHVDETPISTLLGASNAKQEQYTPNGNLPSYEAADGANLSFKPGQAPTFQYAPPPYEPYTASESSQYLAAPIFNGLPDTNVSQVSGLDFNSQGAASSADYGDHFRPLPYWSGPTGPTDIPIPLHGSAIWPPGFSAGSAHVPGGTERTVSIPPEPFYTPPRSPQGSVNYSPSHRKARTATGNDNSPVSTARIPATPSYTPVEQFPRLTPGQPQTSPRKRQGHEADSPSTLASSPAAVMATTNTRKRPYTADTTQSPSDDEKTRKCKENTQAARRYREKKAKYVQYLEENNAAQAETIRLLELEVARLRSEAAAREAPHGR